MPESDQVRGDLRKARTARSEAESAAASARDALKRIQSRETELNRVFNPDDQSHIEEKARLEREKAATESDLRRAREAAGAVAGREAGILKDFALFTDPQHGIERLNDAIPILMMPLRLETRFKTAAVAGAAPVPQLWVRIYPDDCWIDSFEEKLNEAEAESARAYWLAMWQAGGIEDQERGAWRTLASSHGSGRAAYIISQYQPSNLAAKPVKARAEDVILSISALAPLDPGEETALHTFWRAVWLADGDMAQSAAAQAALEAAVGVARAAELVSEFVPSNLDLPLAPGLSKSDVTVQVATVVLAQADTQQAAWTRAPRMDILPDRFVFIGYETLNSQNPVVVLGNPVPGRLFAGIDPSAPKEDQMQQDDRGDLTVPEELKWISEFDRAVEVGMAFRVPLSQTQALPGFERVLVIGLRLNADEQEAKTELETLLRHHSSSGAGLAILSQGTPTNNTEQSGSGHGRIDDPDASFTDYRGPLFTLETDWLAKKDGQWVAEYLGIDPAVLLNVHAAGTPDQACARAMNVALWPATLGYWMETMMGGVFSSEAIEQTRQFFNRYVTGAGACPAIRIGQQPYGILPATRILNIGWLDQRIDDRRLVLAQDPMLAFLRRLYQILRKINQDWESTYTSLPHVGQSGGDPHQILLDIVGLHSGSVEWSQRWAENIQTFYNRLAMLGFSGQIQVIIEAAKRAMARGVLNALGYPAASKDPMILEKIFSGRHNLLKGGVVDDRPLSETDPIRDYTETGLNYIEWLIDAANTSLDALYQQNGFKDDRVPSAILYLLLRHALQLGYNDVSIRLHESAGLYDAAAVLKARTDDPFLHVRENQLISESRYQPLYAVAPQITGSPTQPVHEFIAAQLNVLAIAFYLREQTAALAILKDQPTARLERAFADHIDCCSYRLDAWFLGIVQYQLGLMRNLRDRSDAPARQGVYLGAYGWLEHLRPENKVLTPVRLTDPDLIKDFLREGEPPLVRDSTNQGYIHAPSLNHAVAAAILRNGYLSDASPENRQTMAVNITSERVRTALGMLEGVRSGQGLADLLGYQFERGLHDRHGLAEVDKFIYKLRKAFPLRADRLQSTKTEEGVPIEAIEARNVVDGLALVSQMKTSGNNTYPFGKADLPPATAPEAAAINAEAERLLDSHDAVADLALAEGVYQAVLGNYDRVASTYDAYARGHFPPEPQIIQTPFQGTGLTHRVAIHLEPGLDHTVSPVGGIAMTPRAQGEPAVNRWLGGILPPPDQVGCTVTVLEASTGVTATHEVLLSQLGLQPADLLVLVRDDNQQAMTELDDRLVRFAVANFGPRPDAPVTVRYLEKQAAPFTVFELMPLVRNLRRLVTTSRPLVATDLALMNEAESKQDASPSFNKVRLDDVRAGMDVLRTDLDNFRTQLQGPLSDLDNRKNEILTDVDTYVSTTADLLARAAAFNIPQAGWGFAYDFRRLLFTAILKQADDLVVRWTAKQADLNSIPGFPARFAAFQALAATTRTQVSLLLNDVRALLPITAFDDYEYSVTQHEDAMVRFAEDCVQVLNAVIGEVDRRLAASEDRFDEHDSSAVAAERVDALRNAAKALLGEGFQICPEFPLAPDQGAELANAYTAGHSGALVQHLEEFPVDTWLYGVARVRDKLASWEQTVMLAGAMGRPEPALDPLQLPHIPDDRWLALEFPPETKLDVDRLLYTAHFATPFNPAIAQCGLLVDEWTEVIPGPSADTGLTFHYDRPNSEAPQSMLLVTPSVFRGAWQWDDLVGALNETLDFAKRRAIEPVHIDNTPYAPFLPATIMAAQVYQLTISANLALNNKIALAGKV